MNSHINNNTTTPNFLRIFQTLPTYTNGNFTYLNNNYAYIIFNSNGSILFKEDTPCELLIVGAGGRGGNFSIFGGAGGGGSGEIIYNSSLTIPANSYDIIIGVDSADSNERISKIINNNQIFFSANGGGDGAYWDGSSFGEIQRFPPQIFTSNSPIITTNFINSICYKSTIYVNSNYYEVFYSSKKSNSSFDAINLFNCLEPSSNNEAVFLENQYNSIGSTFNYKKSNYLIDDKYKGDWICIKLPIPILLTSYSFFQNTTENGGAPNNFKIYGSINGIIWDVIKERNSSINLSISYLNYKYTETLSPLQTKPYIYFGLVVNSIIGNLGYLNFNEWVLNGKPIIITPKTNNGGSSIFNLPSNQIQGGIGGSYLNQNLIKTINENSSINIPYDNHIFKINRNPLDTYINSGTYSAIFNEGFITFANETYLSFPILTSIEPEYWYKFNSSTGFNDNLIISGNINKNINDIYFEYGSFLTPTINELWNNNGISFSFWIKPDIEIGDYLWIFKTIENPNEFISFHKNEFKISNNGLITSVNFNINLLDGLYHHFICSINPSGKIFVACDGIIYENNSLNPFINKSYKNGRIGEFFQGSMKDFRIYLKILDNNEILELFKGRIEIFYNRFNEILTTTNIQIGSGGIGGTSSSIPTIKNYYGDGGDGNRDVNHDGNFGLGFQGIVIIKYPYPYFKTILTPYKFPNSQFLKFSGLNNPSGIQFKLLKNKEDNRILSINDLNFHISSNEPYIETTSNLDINNTLFINSNNTIGFGKNLGINILPEKIIPIAWYKFDEPNNLGKDEFNSYNLLLVNNPTFNSTIFNKGIGCVSLSRQNSQYLILNDLNLNNLSFSITLWSYLLSYDNNKTPLFYKRTENENFIISYNDNNIIEFGFNGNSIFSVNLSNDTNIWINWIFTYDNDNRIVRIYKNGLKLTEEFFPYFFHITHNYNIGRAHYNNNIEYYFDGNIDDFRIYNKVLSDNQVQELFNGKNEIYSYKNTNISFETNIGINNSLSINDFTIQKFNSNISFINPSGFFGIGTTNPIDFLDIRNDVYMSKLNIGTFLNSNNNLNIYGNASISGDANIGNLILNGVIYKNNGIPYIDSGWITMLEANSNIFNSYSIVGIGTTFPRFQNRLDVNGSIICNEVYVNGALLTSDYINNSGTTAETIALGTLRKSSGGTGVNSFTSNQILNSSILWSNNSLNILGNLNNSNINNNERIVLNNGIRIGNILIDKYGISNSNSNIIIGNSNKFLIRSNIGIGTTNPINSLDIRGNTRICQLLKVSNISNNDFLNGVLMNVSNISIENSGTINRYLSRWGNSNNFMGFVGIGTTNPRNSLDIIGNIGIKGILNVNNISNNEILNGISMNVSNINIENSVINYKNNNSFIGSRWNLSNSSIFYNSGFVGIRTNILDSNLNINGNFSMKGFLNMNNSNISNINWVGGKTLNISNLRFLTNSSANINFINGNTLNLNNWTTINDNNSTKIFQIFNYTGTIQTFNIPVGVSSINIYCWGAGGGSSYYISNQGGYGGNGGFVSATFDISSSSITSLKIIVGQGGKKGVLNGSSGYSFGGGGFGKSTNNDWGLGGGGGLSGVFIDNANITIDADGIINTNAIPILIGGGGGGAGGTLNTYHGGNAGGSTGNIGNTGNTGGTTPNAGGGGTQSVGGTGAEAGSKYKGGSGINFGAGGGAGWFGGGSANYSSGNVASGGGGSSYLNTSGYTLTNTNIPNAQANGTRTAPENTNKYYQTNIALGADVGLKDGNNGLVIIELYSPSSIGGSGGGSFLNLNNQSSAGTKWSATYSYSTTGNNGTASQGGSGGSAINGGYTETITNTSLIIGTGGTGSTSSSVPVLKTTYGSGGDGNGGLGTQGLALIKVPLNIQQPIFNGYVYYSNITNRPILNDLILSSNIITTNINNQVNFPNANVSWGNEWFLYIGTSPTSVINSFIFQHLTSTINSKWWFNGTTTSTNAEISDERIKYEIRDIPDTLDKLMLLKPKEYYLCDEKDYLKKYGIIAQDVNNNPDINHLVYNDEDYIANVYLYASYINDNGIYKLITNSSIINKINIDDELKLLLNNTNNIEIIIEDSPYNNRYKKRYVKVKSIIDERTIEIYEDIELTFNEKTNIFIYGKKVADFKKLDYSSLYSLNIKATQELYKLIQHQQTIIENLKTKIIELENKIY